MKHRWNETYSMPIKPTLILKPSKLKTARTMETAGKLDADWHQRIKKKRTTYI